MSERSRSPSPSRLRTSEEREQLLETPPSPPLNPNRPLHAQTRAAFNEAPPSVWSQVALVVGILAMLWIGQKLGGWGKPTKPQVIYATRYSDEHRFRPAAYPVITETLRDGRIRLRGANPAGVGVQATDLPKTPKQLAMEREDREKEALEEAKKQLGLKRRKNFKEEKGKGQAMMVDKRARRAGKSKTPGTRSSL